MVLGLLLLPVVLRAVPKPVAPLVSQMLVAADNLHASNPSVAQALKDLDPLPLQEIARRALKPPKRPATAIPLAGGGDLPGHARVCRIEIRSGRRAPARMAASGGTH